MKNELQKLVAKIENINQGFKVRDQSYFRSITVKNLTSLFFEISDALECKVLLDIGAHNADVSLKFVNSRDRKSIAFEANPYTFAKTINTTRTHNIELINAGIGEHIGEMKLHIPNKSKNPTAINSSFKQRSTPTSYLEVLVPMTTLNEVRKKISTSANLALWIDVEGFTKEVLLGGQDLLSDPRLRIIMVELENSLFWSDQALAGEIDEILVRNEFLPVAIDFQAVNQFNALYVRKSDFLSLKLALDAFWEALARFSIGPSSRFNLKIQNSKEAMIYRIKRTLLKCDLVRRLANHFGTRA